MNSLNLVEVGKACGRDVGGIAKGKLTEVCGPPGSGKTAFAYVLQLHMKGQPQYV